MDDVLKYALTSEIKDIKAQVLPNSNNIDPDISDYQLGENLNSILLFLMRYVNNLVIDKGSLLIFDNPLE